MTVPQPIMEATTPTKQKIIINGKCCFNISIHASIKHENSCCRQNCCHSRPFCPVWAGSHNERYLRFQLIHFDNGQCAIVLKWSNSYNRLNSIQLLTVYNSEMSISRLTCMCVRWHDGYCFELTIETTRQSLYTLGECHESIGSSYHLRQIHEFNSN